MEQEQKFPRIKSGKMYSTLYAMNISNGFSKKPTPISLKDKETQPCEIGLRLNMMTLYSLS